MELYFLRHGLAGQHGDPKYKDDSLRPLTIEGRRKLQQCAKGMKNLGLEFNTVLSSPYLRAKQTAEVVTKVFKIKKIYFTDNLLPPASSQELIKEIKSKFPKSTKVLLVGHEPHLSELVCALLASGKPLAIDFKKGGLCHVTVVDTHATLNWLLTPTQLGLLKKKP